MSELETIDDAPTPIHGDFSLKLNFDGALTLEIIQDALKGSQLLVTHTQSVLREILGEEVKLSKVQVRKIEAGSFMGELSAVLDSCGTLLEKAKDIPMSRLITVCTTALLLGGIWSYTELNKPESGNTTVGNENAGIVGDNNQGNTITHNVIQGANSAELASALKSYFPDADELCDKVAEAVVKKQQRVGVREDLKKASVYLSHPGHQSVSSIELTNRPKEGTTEELAKAVIASEVISHVPQQYVKEEPKEERLHVKGAHIQIRRMNVDSCPEGVWHAKVEDLATALPNNRSLVLIVDNVEKAAAIKRQMSKESIEVNMWAVFKRDAKGNPQYLRYILDEVIEH